MRVKVKPKTRQAREIFVYHLKRRPYMFVDDKKDKWKLGCPTTGVEFWAHPTNDPHWELIY